MRLWPFYLWLMVIMAFNSVLGAATKVVTTGFEAEVYESWLAAAPVVILGAPLGAFIVEHVGRRSTLLMVSVLCVGQFVWMMKEEFGALGLVGVVSSLGAVAVMNAGFEWLWRVGDRLKRRDEFRKNVAGK